LEVDFLGLVPANVGSSEGGAYTSCGIELSDIGYHLIRERSQNEKILTCLTDVTAFSRMDRCKSWSIKEKWTDALRRHEQGHFDISEIWARMLDKKLQEMVRTGTCGESLDEIVKNVEDLYDEYISDKDEMQEKYDQETKGGRDDEKQTTWSKEISDLLIAG
jgi:Bacterial protein of unknown function (DUF922)